MAQHSSQEPGEHALMSMTDRQQQARLQIDRDGALPFTKSRLSGASITILGRKGTGKSTTLAVFAEELLKQHVPLVIVDPQGEYYSLAQQFDIIVAGRAAHALVSLDPEKAGALAEFSLTHNVPVVLSLPRYSAQERFTLLRCFFERLWTLEEDLRKPYFVLMEEAHTYLPQVGTTPVFHILSDIFLLGRKLGLGTIMATQRSQKIHKDTISQSEIYLLHKVTHPKDVEVYEELIPLSAKEVRAMIARLRKGSAIAVYEDETLPEEVSSDVVVQVQIRNQETHHVGSTPTFETAEPLALRQLDEALVKELQALLAETQPGESEREQALLHEITTLQEERAQQEEVIGDLRRSLDEQEAQLSDLHRQVDLLSKITVTLDGAKFPALNLPDVLQLDRMQTHVAQATIEVSRAEGLQIASTNGPSASAVSKVDAIPSAEAVGEFMPVTLRFSENKLLTRLLQQVEALSLSEKALLTWLLEHDGEEISSQDLADAVGRDVSVTRSRRTTGLVKFPFVARWGANKFWYKGIFSEYARKHFTSISDPQVIAQQVILAAQS
ncbi:MAG: helicase HerA domain-containing protein [Ktedonobacteraceae bacterium]